MSLLLIEIFLLFPGDRARKMAGPERIHLHRPARKGEVGNIHMGPPTQYTQTQIKYLKYQAERIHDIYMVVKKVPLLILAERIIDYLYGCEKSRISFNHTSLFFNVVFQVL